MQNLTLNMTIWKQLKGRLLSFRDKNTLSVLKITGECLKTIPTLQGILLTNEIKNRYNMRLEAPWNSCI